MPIVKLPPTPGSSTDIRGKEKFGPVAPEIALPPTAYTDFDERAASSTPSSNDSDSSYRPASPASPPKSQRKQSVPAQAWSAEANDSFRLPPPPTRSRKIIQVNPKGSVSAGPRAETGSGSLSVEDSGARGGAKKRGKDSNTTAAGRKVARKTAHSLIERRRRSKMNEEFGVLKDMIPACSGQEMHKLAILQASIDYLRYLERCIVDLKTANEAPSQSELRVRGSEMQFEAENGDVNENDMVDDNVTSQDMEVDQGANQDDDDVLTPCTTGQSPHRTRLPSLASLASMAPYAAHTASPSVGANDGNIGFQHRHYSISTASQASYSPYMHSAQTSPFFGPSSVGLDTATFALTSPALRPQDATRSFQCTGEGSIQHLGLNEETRHQRERREQDLDKEAMTALLMLNVDRRDWKDKSGRALSVRDLLAD